MLKPNINGIQTTLNDIEEKFNETLLLIKRR